MGEVDKSPYPYNLPDNSKAARAERANAPEGKRAEKVVKGTVKVKKNEMRKLTDVFISEDAANVKSYILFDVLVPSIKRAIYDIVVNSLGMSLFGGRGGGDGKRSIADTVSYRDYGASSRRDDHSSRSRSSGGYSYDDITLGSRAEAERVLSCMDEMMDEYGIVRVADLYDLVGHTGEYTDNHYGWTNIRNAEIVGTRDGYRIKMPRPLPIR